jgi:hypothetical protein
MHECKVLLDQASHTSLFNPFALREMRQVRETTGQRLNFQPFSNCLAMTTRWIWLVPS